MNINKNIRVKLSANGENTTVIGSWHRGCRAVFVSELSVVRAAKRLGSAGGDVRYCDSPAEVFVIPTKGGDFWKIAHVETRLVQGSGGEFLAVPVEASR